MSPRVKKGGHVEKTKFQLDHKYFFFLFIHDLLFSPEHQLESEGRFANLSGNFNPLCVPPSGVVGGQQKMRREPNSKIPPKIKLKN